MTHPAIAEAISAGQDAPLPTTTQPAYHAVVHLVVPGTNALGQDIGEAGACDYVAETLRGLFLDWEYVKTVEPDGSEGEYQKPIRIPVSKPYVEGSFIQEVES